MTITKRKLISLAVVGFVFTGYAAAQVELEFGAVPTSITVDNLVVEENVAYLSVPVLHRGDSTDYFVTVSPGYVGEFEPRYLYVNWFLLLFGVRLPYYVYTPWDAVAKDLSVPLDPESTIYGSFNGATDWQTQEATLDFVVPAEQFSRRGDYQDQLTLTLYRGSVATPNSATEVDSVNVDVSSYTGDFSQVLLVPPGGDSGSGSSQYTFDFGALRAYSYRRADLLFRTNMTYSLTLSSQNGGYLEDTVNGITYQVPYTFKSNGSVLDLSNGRIIGFGLLGTGLEFERYEFEATIDEFELVAPGTYEDVITITVSTGG